jgi:hypothetical protein
MIGKEEETSHFVCDILQENMDILVGTIISENKTNIELYTSIKPTFTIYPEWNVQMMKGMYQRQQRVLKDDTIKEKQNILILDNCTKDSTWTHNTLMHQLFMNGRHWKTMSIFCMQYPLDLSVDLRMNIDCIFILREDCIEHRKCIYEKYAGCIPSFEIFCQLMDQYTEKKDTCLVIYVNGIYGTTWEDIVFWYAIDEKK